MNLEVVEFYPNIKKNAAFLGTLHVYLTELDIDIRGIFVKKKGKHWFFGIPYQFVMEDGKKITYPIFSFTNREKDRSLKKIIAEKGKEYILQNKLVSQENTQKEEKSDESNKPRARNTSKFQSNQRRK